MPGNQKRRRRKHRGTQTGSIDRRGRTSRPRSRQEAMAQARRGSAGKRRQPVDRRLIAPTWRSATIRGLTFAALLFPVSLLFGQPVGGAIILSVIAAFFYVPLGYYTDLFFHKRRLEKLRKEREAAQAARAAERGR